MRWLQIKLDVLVGAGSNHRFWPLHVLTGHGGDATFGRVQINFGRAVRTSLFKVWLRNMLRTDAGGHTMRWLQIKLDVLVGAAIQGIFTHKTNFLTRNTVLALDVASLEAQCLLMLFRIVHLANVGSVGLGAIRWFHNDSTYTRSHGVAARCVCRHGLAFILRDKAVCWHAHSTQRPNTFGPLATQASGGFRRIAKATIHLDALLIFGSRVEALAWMEATVALSDELTRRETNLLTRLRTLVRHEGIQGATALCEFALLEHTLVFLSVDARIPKDITLWLWHIAHHVLQHLTFGRFEEVWFQGFTAQHFTRVRTKRWCDTVFIPQRVCVVGIDMCGCRITKRFIKVTLLCDSYRTALL